MIIYHIVSNYEMSDSDGWQYWPAQNHHEYFLTEENAKKEIESKILKDLKELEILSNKFIDLGGDPLASEEFNDVRNNVIKISNGTGRNRQTEEYFRYEIIPINVL